jgi:non-specific serine/threonine protein kinase
MAAAANLRDGTVGVAEKLFRQSLLDLRDTGEHWWLAFCLDGLVQCALARRDFPRAARLHGFRCATWSSVDEPLVGGGLDPQGTVEAKLGNVLGAQLAVSSASGAALSLDEAVEYATGALLDHTDEAGAAHLTPRERRVAELVRDGLTNQAIGNALDISKRTVESHVEHIKVKLGLIRRTQIATWITRERAG